MNHIQRLAIVRLNQLEKAAGRGDVILRAIAQKPPIGRALLNTASGGRFTPSYGAIPGGANLLAQTLKSPSNVMQRNTLAQRLSAARTMQQRLKRLPAALNPMAPVPATV